MRPRKHNTFARLGLVGLFLAAGGALVFQSVAAQVPDRSAESSALFEQMATVLQHPRCMNCHTRLDYPQQGDDGHRHTMNVARGPDGRGAAGLHCGTCHQSANQAASGVPGAPDWHLAPLRMAWEGLTVGELCRALLDPARGGMTPGRFAAHFDTGLVRWAWSPGTDARDQARAAPIMSHRRFVEIAAQWGATGAACPKS
jgi:hypothetical protein